MPSLLTCWLLIFLIGNSLQAKDCGVCGHLFPIAEESFLMHLKNKLETLSEDELNRVLEKIRERQLHLITNPQPLNLPRALHYRSFSYDSSVIAKMDIKDRTGNIVIAKGTHYNPLDSHTLPSPLLFFDATDPDQLDWAKANSGEWILTKGNPLELEKLEGRPVYFDQFGMLSSKLGIRALPARLFQVDKALFVEEIKIEDE
jgi:conjugal transfer pilus assembly protein TraW